MRLDMIHNGCRDEPSLFLAADAPGITFQEEPPGFLPLSPVATQPRALPFPLALPFMFITILSSIRHQLWASRISARCLWSSGYSSSSPASKKDRWHFATVLYPFLGNYIISHSMYYILCDIKATHSTCNETQKLMSPTYLEAINIACRFEETYPCF